MKLTPAQLKGRLKNLANQHRADARTLMGLYMMERFIQQDNNLMTLWKSYQKKYIYAANISYNDIMLSLTNLCELMKGR